MKENKEIIVWQCPECKDIMLSCNWVRHKLDICKCGKSSCDFEEHYTRWTVNPIKAKAKRYDLSELLRLIPIQLGSGER